MSADQLLAERKSFSEETVAKLTARIQQLPEVRKHPEFVVYATGSFGRNEASQHSDIDLFFVDRSGEMPRLSQVLIYADIIRLARDLGLPEFSGDGRYLECHSLQEMCSKLGGQQDDSQNLFTARLLLLLESVPLTSSSTYNDVITQTVSAYYRDYHDHESEFRPIFLVNDILRFWKTLCLNYEHRRNRPAEDQDAKNANHVKNLKLKFSRLMTCYSAVIALTQNHKVIEPESLHEIIRLTPVDRLREVAPKLPNGTQLLNEVIDEYAWFLKTTARPPAELKEWIGDRNNRDQAFARARNFGKQMYEILLRATTDNELLRYIVI